MKINKMVRFIYFIIMMFFMIIIGNIIMIGVKYNLKDIDFLNFLFFLLIFYFIELILNKLGNELGILKLFEFKKNLELILFCFYIGV